LLGSIASARNFFRQLCRVRGGTGLTVLYLAVFGVALIFSLILTRCVRGMATAHGWVSVPDPGRYLQAAPLPRLGGVGVYLSFFAASLFLFLVGHFGFHSGLGFSLRPTLPIVLGSFVILLLGVWDDIRGLGPYSKIAVECIAGLILFSGGFRFVHFRVLFGNRLLPWYVDLAFTLFWVLGITNAFNLIDGVDGLAAGSALFSTVAVFVVALVSHAALASFLTIALSGAILGFLHYNLNPATIFLGDSGSLFIGFMLSALALQSAQKAPTMLAVAIPVVSFGLPILETILSVVRRWISGRPVFSADEEHIHHKLLARGFSQRKVVVILYGVSAIFGLVSLFLLRPGSAAMGVVFVVLGIGIWLGVQHLGYLEFGELRRVAQRTIDQRRVFVNNLAVRRAIEELQQVHDYDHLYRVLVSAFSENDFDAFELRLQSPPGRAPEMRAVDNSAKRDREPLCLWWRKPGSLLQGSGYGWCVSLDLVSGDHPSGACLTIYRHYSERALQLDVNMLTAEFPGALAEALVRARVGNKRIGAASEKDAAARTVAEAS
jgi:UDP-GlcNAc:undecaprenyl-phosphate GlcNAc-1-phosphate transferase